MRTPEEAQRAIERGSGSRLDGRNIKVQSDVKSGAGFVLCKPSGSGGVAEKRSNKKSRDYRLTADPVTPAMLRAMAAGNVKPTLSRAVVSPSFEQRAVEKVVHNDQNRIDTALCETRPPRISVVR
jgi:hypothetical protein